MRYNFAFTEYFNGFSISNEMETRDQNTLVFYDNTASLGYHFVIKIKRINNYNRFSNFLKQYSILFNNSLNSINNGLESFYRVCIDNCLKSLEFCKSI